MMRLLHSLLLLGTACILVVPGVYVAAPVLLSLAGVFLIRRASAVSPIPDPDIRTAWKSMLGGFAAFALSGLLLNLYHGESDPGAYERLLPFVILPALVWTIRAGGWSPLPWIAALGVGAGLAGAHAMWEYALDPAIRATGATDNAIKFGHTAVLLSGLCVLAALFYPFPNRAGLWRAALLLAGLCGAQASILSGSKGGWPILLILIATILVVALRRGKLRDRLVVVGMTIAVVAATLAFAPTQMMRDRIISGLDGGLHWFRSGGEVTEGSVSIRFELWSAGLQIFTENPVFGAGNEEKTARWTALAKAEDKAATLGTLNTTSAHNDLIETLAQGGLIGLAGHAAAFLGAWLAFWRLRAHPEPAVAALAGMGLFVIISFLIFGLAVSAFWMSIFRSTFVVYSLILLSLITVRASRRVGTPVPETEASPIGPQMSGAGAGSPLT